MLVAQGRVEELQIKKLLHCVRTEDYYQIKKLCEKGVNQLINYNEPKDGETALILAASMNNDRMVQFLLELGAHPNVVDFQGRTALMKAAQFGHVQVMEVLKKAKADPRIRDNEGKGVLFYCLFAPTHRHDKCMEICLSMDADVNNITNLGTPIFVEACKKASEHKAMCLMLLDHGSDPGLTDERTQRNALQNAAASGSHEVCRAILRKGGDPNLSDKLKHTAAHDASKGGHFNVLTVLSAHGAHFDVYDVKGNNPIHFAAASGSGVCCRFLATRGCNPKAKNLMGETPKSIAKDKNAKDASKNIRKGEVQYNKMSKQATDSGGINWSIRLYDYMSEHRDRMFDIFQKFDETRSGRIHKDQFIEILINEGFQNFVETEEMKRLISMHEKETDYFDYEIFLSGKKYINKQFLLSSFLPKTKKKKKPKGKRGKTKVILPICTTDEGPRQEGGDPPVLFQPKHIQFTDMNRFNRDHPPKHPLQDDSPWYLKYPERTFVHLCDAANRGDLHTLLDAFKKGVSPDVRDKYFKTPLMVAASHGDIKTCKFLLECGADIDAKDNFKWTPLHHACHSGQLDVVQLLIEAGANINALSITSSSPFMRAVESASYPVVEYLMQKGARIQQENIQGKTAFDIAKEFADPRVYFAVKNKMESLPVQKDSKKQKKKGDKTKKKDRDSDDDRPEKLLPTITRRSSFTKAETLLTNYQNDSEKIMFKPLHLWTEQETTEQLLEQKRTARDRYGWEVDFPDFKMPFMKSIKTKVDKLGLIDAL